MSETEKPKIALITGASRGLGYAMALQLARKYHVVALAKTTGALEELDDQIQQNGDQATLAPMDITNPDAMAQLCRSIYDRWGGLDLWVHTAIFAAPLSPAAHLDSRDLDKSMKINVAATAVLIQMLAPLLNKNKDSQAVFFDDPCAGEKFFGAYGASKAAQMALVQSWQRESKRIGPRVRILTPNPMPTATRARFYPGEDRNVLNTPAQEATRLLAEL